MAISRNFFFTTLLALGTLAVGLTNAQAGGGCSSRGGSSYGGYRGGISYGGHHSSSYSRPISYGSHYSTPSRVYSQPIQTISSQPSFGTQIQSIRTVSSQPVQQAPLQQVQQAPAQQQLQPVQQSQPVQQVQQPTQQPLQQVSQAQPAAPAQAPNAQMSALQALGGFAPPAPAQAQTVQPSQPTPAHVGQWTASLGNGAKVQLTLNANGQFSWVATNQSGSASSFSGTYTISDGSLNLLRSNDNQQLSGSMNLTGNAFSFKVAGQNAAALNFARN